MPKLDPVFGLPTPLLFAHRGGAQEAPESTVKAFEHARKARSDVLELDVNLTRDGKIAVWHGPSLKNVRISGQSDIVEKRVRKEIRDFDWSELKGQAWVSDPGKECGDVGNVPEEPDRLLLLLEDTLSLFPDDHIDIELKGDLEQENVGSLIKVLENSSGSERHILIVSADHKEMRRVEKALGRLSSGRRSRYALGLSALSAALAVFIPFLGQARMTGRALQTTYWRPFCSKRVVQNVHKKGGAVHAFITSFGPIRGLDAREGGLRREELFRILRRGVDGIMTDRPGEVRPLLDEWIECSRLT